MAFTPVCKGRVPLNPPVKRYKEAGILYWEWYEFTNDSGSTGGAITTTGDTVIMGIPAISTASPGDVQVELDTPAAGQVTITTTADKSGRLLCLIHKRKG